MAHRRKSQRKSSRAIFSTLSSPIMSKAILIKQNYGFFEKDLYVIKSHRKKESSKVRDTCQLADLIIQVAEENQQLVSSQILERVIEVKGIELGLHELQQDSIYQGNSYIMNDTLYTLKRSKLLLTKEFMEELRITAKRAEILTGKIKDLLEFYPAFLAHLLENELAAVNAVPNAPMRAIRRL